MDMNINNQHLEDWQRGNDSTTLPLNRLELMNEWLKRNKLEVIKREKVEEDIDSHIGFDDLPMYE